MQTEFITLTGQKAWEDFDDAFGLRPDAPYEEGKDGTLVPVIRLTVTRRAAAQEGQGDPHIEEKLTEGGDPGQAGETEKTSGDTEKETRTGTGMDRSTAAGILKAMRPAVAAIKDEKERLAVSDALIRLVMAEDTQDDISAVLKASQANGKKAAVNMVTVDTDAIQDAYDAMNPHRGRKETK